MTRTTNPKVRTLVLASMLALSTACVFQELGDLPAFQFEDQGSDMPGTNNGQDMAEDADPDLLDMAPDLPVDMPEDMLPDVPVDMPPDVPEDVPPDMPDIPSGLVCFTQNPPPPSCNPVEQTGCLVGDECKIVIVSGALTTRCIPPFSGELQEGQSCNPASTDPECGPDLSCVVNVCRQICRIHDAYGCDPTGSSPACRNEFSQSGFGTCWPTCQP